MRKGMLVLVLLVSFAIIPIVLAATVNNDPIAVAKVSPASCFACECEVIWLDGSGSSDSDGQVVKYEWLYNDKVVARGVSATLGETFTRESGGYTIFLRVTDNGGATNTVSAVKLYVENNPRPQIEEMSWEINDNKDFLTQGDKFTVEVDLIEKEYGKITYNWDYNSEMFQKVGVRQSRNGEEAIATFKVISNEIGWKTSYEIGVAVSNACGEGDTEDLDDIKVKSSRFNQPPEAKIIFLSSVINEGESFQVNFACTTGQDRNEGGDEVVDWYWEIRNERGEIIKTSYSEDPRFKIEDSGIFIICLNITDRFGATGETSVHFKVEEYDNDKPVANASATGITAVYGEPHELNGSNSWDPDERIGGENYSISWYIWRDETYGEEFPSSKNPVCNVSFNRTGPHKIVLEVRDAGARVEKGDDEIEVSFDTDEIEINVIVPSELAPAPVSSKPTPTSTPVLEKNPAPTKNFLENFWEIIETIKALF